MIGILFLLASPWVAATANAKVLRNNNSSPTVWVFKDANGLSRFNKLASTSFYNESAIAPLVACKAEQGSKVDVLGSGHRTAFVRVIDGSAAGCEGTVPIGSVRDR